MRSINKLFSRIDRLDSKVRDKYTLFASMFQIYNESVYDLLNLGGDFTETGPQDAFQAPLGSSNFSNQRKASRNELLANGLKMRLGKNDAFDIQDLSIYQVDSAAEAIQIYVQGIKNKIVSSHKLNHASSRSHVIFSLQVHKQSEEEGGEPYVSRLMLVDLAGSERLSYLDSGLTNADKTM